MYPINHKGRLSVYKYKADIANILSFKSTGYGMCDTGIGACYKVFNGPNGSMYEKFRNKC